MIDASNNTIHTVNILIHFRSPDGVKYLLVQEDDKSWGLPGGAKDIGDNNYIDPLVRELNEELGYSVALENLTESKVTYEFVYSNQSSSRHGRKGVEHLYVLEVPTQPRLELADDLADVGWFLFEEAIDKLVEVPFFAYRVDIFKDIVQEMGL